MRLCTASRTVPRTWTVELRPQRCGPELVCPRCRPVTTSAKGGATARSAVLAHLARHARLDALPLHLRTCQCHERGCRWHPRHRGCSGPIVLALAREQGGRLWRLADVCTACAGATNHAAIVPEPQLAAAPSPRKAEQLTKKGTEDPSARIRVRDMLSYLAVALPSPTGPQARLLALQCALRADGFGRVRLPHGLLRGMHLHSEGLWWRELEQAHWLYRPPLSSTNGTAAQLLDATLLSPRPGRRGRARGADWALRTASTPALRDQSSAGLQLTAVVLAAHSSAGAAHATADAGQVARSCGLIDDQLVTALKQLTAAGALSAWTLDATMDDLAWQATQALDRVSARQNTLASEERGLHRIEMA
ncbi:hypothetical protein [Streptomyces sp. NBC_00063]|uniref:hypothetical protein n=1 Tax=Streptomyces sp. NBC_00063 TaxID=2975638 RepID=UPI002256A1AE|nr:hypothetical protein [Streptomyces sp. NBC_00063]MCX5443867.1 hypothetical protein [Streptomyces sp. NBC_00063]